MTKPTCVIDGCERPERYRRNGWCDMHYKRWSRHGDPLFTVRAPEEASLDERLRRMGWSERTVVTELGPCWEWQGCRTPIGYGQLRVKGRGMIASRAAYTAWVDEIPDGLYVCHACDNPPCINPSHLYLGDQSRNMGDCDARGRTPHGTRNGHARLTDADVAMIRVLVNGGSTQAAVARAYGVDPSHVSRIMSRQHWRRAA